MRMDFAWRAARIMAARCGAVPAECSGSGRILARTSRALCPLAVQFQNCKSG